jgi:hypothetical protein
MILNFRWMIEVEMLRDSPRAYFTFTVPFVNVVFILLLFTVLNLPLKRFLAKSAFSSQEIMVLYIILSLSSTLCTHNSLQILLSLVGHVSWFATPENDWQNLIMRHLPGWIIIRDSEVLRGFYQGESSLYLWYILKSWIKPLFFWTIFVFALLFVMLCFNLILRKRWIEREKLAYPIIQLPLAIAGDSESFFRNRIFWIGFGVASSLSMLNNLNWIFPQIPSLALRRYSISQFFTRKPLSQIGGMSISLPPYILGLTFLIPLELLFSCWFFYLLHKGQILLSSVMGWRSIPRFPFSNEQSMGAVIGLSLMLLWSTRNYFRDAIGFLKPGNRERGTESVNLRMAFSGMVFGIGFLILFSFVAGMSLWVIAIFFPMVFAIALIVTRIRAELGFPKHDLQHVFPHHILALVLGTRKLGPANLTVLSLYHWFNRSFAAHPMPHQLEALKIADQTGISIRKILMVILFTTLFGTVGTFWVLLHVYYNLGAETPQVGYWASGMGREVFRYLEFWLSYPREPNIMAGGAIAFGACFAIFLMIMRIRFIWWYFHPLGYVLAPTMGMDMLWFCLLISFILKWGVLKIGGLKLYNKILPFFFGLILGEVSVGCIWYLIGWMSEILVYPFSYP